MRVRAPWLLLACVASSACGLSTVGLDGEKMLSPEEAGGEADATSSGEGSAPADDAAADAHHASDGSLHKPDATSDAAVNGDASNAQDTGSTVDGPTDAGPGDSSVIDDAPEASTTGGCDGSAACVTVPSGWTLVAFAGEQSTACPTGFQTPTNLVEGPNASGACACGTCSVTGSPSCASGAINVFYDNVGVGGGTCAMPAMSPMLNNSPAGACGAGSDVYHGNYTPFDLEYIPPAASGGTCSAPGAASGPVVYSAHDRTCVASSPQAAHCTGNECAPGLQAPYAACIMQSGNVACPAGPLGVAHLAGSGVSFACSACGCSVSATCTGTITLYTDNKCKTPGVQIPADGSCNRITSLPNSASTYTFGAYTYAANAPSAVQCAASGTSSAQNVALAGLVTICCAQ